jgi:O-antigen ligase
MYENDSTARGKHSHSSFIDLTVGAGVLSTILWLLFIIKLFLYSFQKYKINVSYYSIAISILTVDFVSRSLIDSIMRDHMFQQYMLILGILLAMLIYGQNSESKSV